MITLLCQAVDNEFYPLEGIFAITIPPTHVVGQIKSAVVKSEGIPRPQFNRILPDNLNLWKLSVSRPVDDEDEHLAVKSLLDDVRNKRASVEELKTSHRISKYFEEENPPDGLLQLIVHVPVSGLDVSQRARNDVNDVFTNYGFPHIDSQFITIHVKNYTTWTEKDVRNSQNCIKLLWNAKDDRPKPNDTLDSVRRKLDKKRVLNSTPLAQTDYAAFIEALNREEDPIFDASGENNMVSTRELDAHNHAVRNYMNWVDIIRGLSSSLKEGWFRSALVAPPMLEVVRTESTQEYKFNSGVGWNFSILVAVGKGKSYRRYSPMPDFMLLPSPKVSADDEKMGFCPILLGEVVSRADEGDRWRMLLQLAICARVNSLVTEASHSPLVVQAVYLSKGYCAERYLAYADRNDSNLVPSVYITRDKFEVATRDGTVKFLRSMYNFKDVVMDADNAWDNQKGGLCATLATSLRQLPGLTSQSKTSKPTKSSGPSGNGRLSPIVENADALTQHGYTIYKLSTTHRHIAYANTLQGEVVLKCINKARRANEIELLAYLHQTSRPGNHTIPFTRILSTQTDVIISMPHRKPLNECSALSVPIVTDFGRQLVEAVWFMHGQGVAHRDLKPENVVVDLHMHQLSIIDYDLAMFVDGRNEMVHGYVGTDGFTAPEVGDDWKERYYSPIAADLWATGRVLEFLLSRSDDPKSPKLKLLRSISRRLLDDDPAQRPGADEALDDILLRAKHPPFYKSSEQRDSSQTEYWTPRHPRPQLTGLEVH